MTRLNVDQLDYLRTLVERDIRNRERGLTKLQRKPGQPVEEFDGFVERAKDWVEFLGETLEDVDEELRVAREEDDDA